jgi:hypothetical protein
LESRPAENVSSNLSPHKSGYIAGFFFLSHINVQDHL